MNTLIVSQENEIGYIYFNRPEQANTINEEMIEELEITIEQFSQNDKLKALIFRGYREIFVSGGDLNQHQQMSGNQVYPLLYRVGKLLDQIAKLNVITIAAVEGKAIGGGCEIVSSCDFCVASSSATFQFIQARLGITTAWGGGSRLMKKIGTKKGLQLLLTGEQISSHQGHHIGLVDWVYEDEHFTHSLKKLLKKLTRPSKPAIYTFKKMAQLVESGVSPSQIYPLEAQGCAECWDLEKHQKSVNYILSPLLKQKSNE
ncbi:enoyl-CoA hydratase/3-hydroxypropionyl-coenzyme A dehydratase [Seinonella peptonophila]|uniref:Ethylmalonyl-CoA decarboxylase n=1 Tax=Seinonella peptonophila TaxID=112248 RepID=A0A1M5ADV7_9BACL|nr:enoyl-CoA hydratase/isomerase family protein [Seinonella peptonophila]SHF28480.1 enoyl-CoA hydratase/3-hydroxypropionyl-coenzyme A dehydratase [Seinonella peptonophila]